MFVSLFLLIASRPVPAQQQQQPLQTLGYVDLLPFPGDGQLNPRNYADWAYVLTDPASPGGIINLTGPLQTLHGNGAERPIKAFIDLGGLLWQKVEIDPAHGDRYDAYPDYQERWRAFRLQHIVTNPDGTKTDYLSSAYVLAYNVVGEPTVLHIPMTKVAEVAKYIKYDACSPEIPCYGTPNTSLEYAGDVANPSYTVLADYIDWWGVDIYGIHPASNNFLRDAMANLRTLKNGLAHSEKKLFYIMDGWWEAGHQCAAPRPSDMAGIAQEWFNVASSDPDATLIGVVAFHDLLATGSLNLPRNVLDKQAQIGLEIRNHLLPAYQGDVEGADCQSISGWAWDSNQPDVSVLGTPNYKNPVSVDFYLDNIFFKRVDAQNFRQDLLDNGKGNGSHGFKVPTPDFVKNGAPHSLSVRVAGMNGASSAALPLSCSSPSFAFTTELAYGQVGVPYLQSIWNGGNPADYIFSPVEGQIPPGLTIDAAGTLVGVPTSAGAYLLKVRVTERTPSSCNIVPATLYTFTRIFSIIIQCGSTGCPPQLEGYNDGSNPDSIWGWTWDRVQPNTPMQVDIYDNAADVVPNGAPLLARVNANLFRQDLLDAGRGDGNHAFVFPVPAALKDGNPHRIHVTFAGTNTELTWSPHVVVTSSGRFVGAHSTNTCDRIDGFALDNWQPNAPIDVNIFDNGLLLASMVANYDSSVVPATTGNGAHGFLYYTPDRLRDGNRHEINITFKLSGYQLSNTDQALVCPAVTYPSLAVWEGWFDNVTCDRVDGWGWDVNRPNTPVDMALFADGTRVATLTANYFSQDLLDAGKGNGTHRFLYYLPDSLKDGGQHHITAQIVGQGVDLPISSPITNGFITCAALPAPVAPPPRPTSVGITGNGISAYGHSVLFFARVNWSGSGPAPTGTVTFLDGAQVLGVAQVDSASQASFSANFGSAGTHSVTASYSGDSFFLASSAQVLQVVTPVPLQVTANNKTRMYGDPNPPFDGTITGLVNGDNIQALYSTTATAQSLVGNYPITPTLSDPTGKLGNYFVTLQNGTLAITRSNIALALPSFTPASGIYLLGQPVTISETTSGTAAIHYTTDGSTPTAASPIYSGPIILNAAITLKAMATQPEYTDSAVASANYAVQIPVSATPAALEAQVCGSATSTVSVPALNGVSGSLALSVSGVPAGVTVSFNPASIVSPGSSTLTATPSSSTPPGNYSFRVVVTSATLSGNTTVQLKIKACK